jgi:hypothetical protein
MMANRLLCAGLAALSLVGAARAQDVSVRALPAPDLFSTGGGETGLGPDLWRGASEATFRTVLPMLAEKPLSPAARGLARRVLATGAAAPDGVGEDRALAAARVSALMALGGVAEVGEILQRTPGLDAAPEMAQVAAEAALLTDDPSRACAIAEGLSAGRDDIYWLRLRAYCQLRAGKAGPAQLTFDLAQSQARDATYGRLMGAKLAGAGDPGAASLRNGLDYALSRDLALDLAAAKPAPAVAAALNPQAGPAPPQVPDPDLAAAIGAATAGTLDMAVLDRLVARAATADAKARPKAQNAALLLAALGAPAGPHALGEMAAYAGAEAKASAARLLALDLAAEQKLTGQTALLALWISAEAGAAGPPTGDRVRIIRALRAAALEADARAYAVEGLAAQQ